MTLSKSPSGCVIPSGQARYECGIQPYNNVPFLHPLLFPERLLIQDSDLRYMTVFPAMLCIAGLPLTEKVLAERCLEAARQRGLS